MAKATYTASTVVAGSGGLGSCQLGLFNAVGSGKILRVYFATLLRDNNGASNILYTRLHIIGLSDLLTSDGSAVDAVKHDSNSPALGASIRLRALSSFADNGKVYKSIDYETRTNVVSETWRPQTIQSFVPLVRLWDAQSNTDIDPITLREGEGAGILSSAPGVWGRFLMTFTVE